MDFNLHRPSGHSQAMDFNVYAGADDSSFTCTPPNGYFATQALRVGLLGKTTMHSLPRPFPEHREIGREIMKERIREEIIAGEMAERKILEEEVRKELEMERIMKMRRSQMERTRFSLLADTSDTVNRGNQMMQPFFPSYPQARSGPSRNFARDAAEFTFRERSPTHLRQKKPMMVVDESFLHHNSEKFLPSEQARSGPSRNFARDAAEFTFCERSPAHPRQKKPMILVEESFLHHNSKKFLPSKQVCLHSDSLFFVLWPAR
ncbi:hypothetical protein KSP40_PGU010265 [Platanthera guangdongensis]|uniref:Uncharacterized protein n=1 Tax=Platanthera guangdongensis TaxID=2320717 RepID=A0ABR2LWF0_9ASPA